MTDEKKLLRALKSGNIDTIELVFNYIYDKYKPLVIFVASKYVQRIDVIDDIVQETFISFFNNISAVKTNIKSYLTTTVKNKAIDYIRRNKKIELVDDIENIDINNYFEDVKNSDESYIELVDSLKKTVGEEDAIIILMHLIDDLKFEEIACKYNINTKTIKSRYYRALKKFKERHH